ncbi:MAG TPA: hypothetical protein VD794_06310 [Flavisolibacter sp.]|nr:hypothetical protein [Flavisolibacter sp.]
MVKHHGVVDVLVLAAAAVHHPEEVVLRAGDAQREVVNKKGFIDRQEKDL